MDKQVSALFASLGITPPSEGNKIDLTSLEQSKELATTDTTEQDAKDRIEWLESKKGYFSASSAGEFLTYAGWGDNDQDPDRVSALVLFMKANPVVFGGKPSVTALTKKAGIGKVTAIERDTAWQIISLIPDGVKAYVRKVVARSLVSGFTGDDFISYAMKEGLRKERLSVDSFNEENGITLSQTCSNGQKQAFIKVESLNCGFTTDGCIYRKGFSDGSARGSILYGFETKSQFPENHLENLMVHDNASLMSVQPRFGMQIQVSLFLSGADYWIFRTYCPEFEEANKSLVSKTVKILPDPLAFKMIYNRLVAMNQYRRSYMKALAAI